jgi:hypothetical protein
MVLWTGVGFLIRWAICVVYFFSGKSFKDLGRLLLTLSRLGLLITDVSKEPTVFVFKVLWLLDTWKWRQYVPSETSWISSLATYRNSPEDLESLISMLRKPQVCHDPLEAWCYLMTLLPHSKHSISIIKADLLFREILAAYSESNTKHINIISG